MPDAGELRGWAAELVDRARNDGVELTGDDGLLTALVRQVLQTGLEVEMTDHLGYEPHASGSTATLRTIRVLVILTRFPSVAGVDGQGAVLGVQTRAAHGDELAAPHASDRPRE